MSSELSRLIKSMRKARIEEAKIRYKQNKNKDNATYYRRERRNRRRANGGEVSKADWDEMVRRCGDTCIVPGCWDSPVTQDHVIPIVKGGKHCIENLQPLCRSCNSSKGTRIVDYRD